MKLLTVFFLLTTTVVYGQQTSFGNFKVMEQEIIYQKIVPLDTITAAKLEAYYKSLPYVSNLKLNENSVEFEVN